MRIGRLLVAAAVCAVALPFQVNAQVKRQDPVQWSLTVVPPAVAPGAPVVARLKAAIEEGWHLYSPTTGPGPIPTQIQLRPNPGIGAGGKLYQPAPQKKFDPNFNSESQTFEKEVEFWFLADVEGDAEDGKSPWTAEVRYQVCSDKLCLRPVTKMATAELVINSGARAVAPMLPAGYSEVPTLPKIGAGPGGLGGSGAGDGGASGNKGGGAPATVESPGPAANAGLVQYLLVAFGFGLAAIFTPCVFPMIPITMSYFVNATGHPMKQAIAFCAGIVVLFTGLGFATTAALGPFGVVQLGSNPWVNAFIAAVFVAFGLSLLGAFEITLPSGLLTRLDGASQGGGFPGTVLMGLTFALTSFACVGPFMGTLLAASVQGGRLQPVMGMASFAGGLASPFFFLALFPGYIAKMPRSGGWLARVKIVMGFVVLAAALKYLSNVDQVLHFDWITRERFLAAWVVLLLLPGLYLLGLLRMEGIKPDEHVGVGRALAAAGLLIAAISLVPGMFGGNLGEMEAYVPAATASLFGGGKAETPKLVWLKDDYRGALAKAEGEGKTVLVNFTGYACTNCKWMKANMFPRPAIHAALEKLVLVDLYTDGSDATSLENQRLQETKFQTVAIPHYALVRPNSGAEPTILAAFEGLTKKEEEFLAFLNHALEQQAASNGSGRPLP
jgi:thiol:disulfide interchange protein DsbD